MGEPALRDLCIKLLPAEPLPNSYFGLLRRLVDVPARIDAWKRSTCIEGALLAFAHVKVEAPVLKSAQVVTGGPPANKPYRTPELYMADAMEGALEIEKRCTKEEFFP
jgi:hypothetical protein